MKWKSNAKYNVSAHLGTSFASEVGDVIIHRIHHLDGWYLTCRDLGIESLKLDATSFEDATATARKAVADRLIELTGMYNTFLNDHTDEIVRHFREVQTICR